MDEVFTVLADPTRRQIIELLAEREHSAGELVAVFPVSQPAISRHLRVLRESGFVRVRGDGQRRIYTLEARRLSELDDWLAHYRRFWSARLDDLDAQLEAQRRQATGPDEKE
jgi:DNA-binding transcriptional ArsR family regulator